MVLISVKIPPTYEGIYILRFSAHYCTFLFLGYQNGLNVMEPVAGASGISGLSSSDGGSLAGNGPNDAEGPPPDLPPLPMPRCGSYCSLSFASVIGI